ncbi:MAG: HlyC/CorC family transporter [Chloroflexi bacterium]|nr:MAG: HlyC/CorC family transporter [Chloroflexota bacterium]
MLVFYNPLIIRKQDHLSSHHFFDSTVILKSRVCFIKSIQEKIMLNGLIEIVIILILVLFNGFLALTEIAFVSSRKVKLKERAGQGDKGAQAALHLLERPEQVLSTVQVGITLIAIMTGVFGGATLAGEVELLLEHIPVIEPYAGAISVALIVLATTYISLVIGELTPKQIGLRNPETIASRVAPGMQWAARQLSLVVNFLSFSTRSILRLLRFQPQPEVRVTDEEIKLLIQQGMQGGVFEAIEEHVIDRLFHLSDQRIRAIMTPRVEVTWLDSEDEPEKIYDQIFKSGFMKFPVATGDLDHLSGVVNASDLLAQKLAGETLNLESLAREALVLPESMPAFSALEQLRQSPIHMALVINEYGGVEGLITATDILEALVGDFPDKEQFIDPDIVQREDGSWLIDGMVSINEIMDLLNLREVPVDENDRYDTLGGLVLAALEQIPSTGDQFDWQEWHFEVMDMDGHRVDKVLVTSKVARPDKGA